MRGFDYVPDKELQLRINICTDTFDTFGTFLQNVNNALFFHFVLCHFDTSVGCPPIKKTESVKNAKSVMSFFK